MEEKKEENNKMIDKKQLAEMGLIMPKNITDTVMNTVKQFEMDGQLVLPEGYNAGNALKSAYLTLQNTKDKNGRNFMEVCTKDSVARALLDMVVQGLDVGQKQAYFIVRGNELTLMRSYFGSQTILRRISGIKDVWATIIYADDEIEVSVVNGERVISKHETKFGNEDGDIVGAYAVIEMEDGTKKYTIMTKKEIDKCWAKSSSSQHTVHKEFPQEMAKRTVINRACKNYVNTDTKNQVLGTSFIRTTENDYEVEEIEDEEPEQVYITKIQVMELANLIGEDVEKAKMLYDEYGYDDLNNIKVEEYDEIYNKLKGGETSGK